MIWKSIVVLLFLKVCKWHFNLSHITKVSAQTLASSAKDEFSWEKPYKDFLILLNKKYFTLILKVTILINCTGKSVTDAESFKIQKQPPKVFLKISQNSQETTYARVSFLIKLQASASLKRENIQDHICIGLQVSLSYTFRKTKDWVNPHNDWNKVLRNLENKLTDFHSSKTFFVG